MIRIKNTPKCRQKLTKMSVLDSMKFMRTGSLMGKNQDRAEMVEGQSSSEEIIITLGEPNQMGTFVENKAAKSRVVYYLKKKSEQDQKANEKLPVFFRQVQRVSKLELLQVKMQNKQWGKMESLLLNYNEPFRQSYQ